LRTLHHVSLHDVSFHFCSYVGSSTFWIGFAALTMNKELGFTAEVYGFGAGVFFFGEAASDVATMALRPGGAKFS
jgi:ACS family tartrate transporter-like MFS transporter